MPTPSTWAIGVAAPSTVDPYQALEQSITTGDVLLGAAGGEGFAQPAQRKLKGNVTEIFDWKGSPAIWILAAILIAIGVLHLGGGFKGSLGPANVGGSAEL